MTPFGIRKRLRDLFGPKPAEPAAPRRRYPVSFSVPDGSTYLADAKHGDSLVLTSGRGPQPIATGCADGTCATCRVEVLAGADSLSAPTDHEGRTKRNNAVDASLRLGCQTHVLGEGVKVRVVNAFSGEAVA